VSTIVEKSSDLHLILSVYPCDTALPAYQLLSLKFVGFGKELLIK